MSKPALILASQSAGRQAMLRNAGLEFSAMPAKIDEEFIMEALKGQGAKIPEIAAALAREKALEIAGKNPGVLVIGSDQILEFKGKIMTKAEHMIEAREKLALLKGQTHKLISAVAVAKDDQILWQDTDEAVLTMHDFDEAFLDDYCAQAGEALTRAVGAYEIESSGAWLFSSVKGDYFTIMGMPLLSLLGYLRERHGIGP